MKQKTAQTTDICIECECGAKLFNRFIIDEE
jgi:hypothetical protein